MIYLIITTCINNHTGIIDAEQRKRTYMDSIQQVLSFVKNDATIKPIIVENNGVRQTYLDDLGCDVCYTYNNYMSFIHKGEIELLDIKHVIDKYQIQDDDTIIKLTGRYKCLDPYFLDLVKNNCDVYDAFVKFFNVCTFTYTYDDCVLGLFAIRCKYMKDFNYWFSLSPENEFAEYIFKNVNKKRIMGVKELRLECCFADDLRVVRV